MSIMTVGVVAALTPIRLSLELTGMLSSYLVLLSFIHVAQAILLGSLWPSLNGPFSSSASRPPLVFLLPESTLSPRQVLPYLLH